MQRLYECLGMLNSSDPTQDIRQLPTNDAPNIPFNNDHNNNASTLFNSSTRHIVQMTPNINSVPAIFPDNNTSNSPITPGGNMILPKLPNQQYSARPVPTPQLLDLTDVNRPTVPHRAKPVSMQAPTSTNDTRDSKVCLFAYLS